MTKYQQGGFELLGYGAYRLPASEVARVPAAQKNQLLLAVKNKGWSPMVTTPYAQVPITLL